MSLCQQKPHPLHSKHLVALGRFSAVTVVDDETIILHDGTKLEEYGHPVVVAAKVGMVVINPLFHDVYTTHPVIVVINEGRYVHLSFSVVSPNFVDVIFIFYCRSWALSLTLDCFFNSVNSANTKHHAIVHPLGDCYFFAHCWSLCD